MSRSPGEREKSSSSQHRALAVTGALLLLVVTVGLSLAIGAKSIPLSEVVRAFTTSLGGESAVIVKELRLPRTVAGLLVGAALGLAGTLMQALTRNPLADPGILGVNAGAALAVAIGVSLLGLTGLSQSLALALFGALAATAAVYLIGGAGRARVSPVRLTLAGVALTAVLAGLTRGLILIDAQAFDHLRGWEAGALSGRSLLDVGVVAPLIIAGLVLGLVVSRPLDTVALGDDVAAALGTNVLRLRVLVVVAGTLLAGASTALCGPIGFLGLCVAHVARLVVGPDQRWIAALTLVLSPSLLLASDVLGRLLLRPSELPVGIVMAFVGAPVLILLVRQGRVRDQ